MRLSSFFDLVGLSRHEIHYTEVLISAVGGFIGIAAIYFSAQWVFDPQLAVLIVPSMGASAVLLFAAPNAPFSQPWNLIVGHALSALIGVACWQWIPNLIIAASASVALAIGVMYVSRSIHPPGGATALAAVIGSDRIHALGFAYEFQPILINVLALLIAAIVVNGFFRWRRYPAYIKAKPEPEEFEPTDYPPINHEDFVYALSQIDTFVDISEDDLIRIYQLATRESQRKNPQKPSQ
ncbi:MAG: hypothetical protein GY806_09905 [Gammaproteobacteria bacterium]|nr:hypothetical protein [Gammaproteobacteria bacterium]